MHESFDDLKPAAVCDGGNLDCGSGLLLVIRNAMSQVPAGQVLEIRSTEISVCEDLPAWCRMTENPFLGWTSSALTNRYFVRRGAQQENERAELDRAKNYQWQCRVHWKSGLTCTSYARNHSWEIGQPASFDVRDAAPSAVELLLSAIGSSLVMAFQIQTSRSGLTVAEAEMSVTGKLDNVLVFLGLEKDGRSGFRDVSGTLYVRSDAHEAALQQIFEQVLRRSPIISSLAEAVQLSLQLQVIPS